MHIKVLQHLDEISATDWNGLAGTGNPFLRHEFLLALEQCRCVCPEKGWLPQHLALMDGTNRLLAAVPLYLKNHSWGEYIFDWAWANAYMRAGLEYYPKLTAAIPFTPATGHRILLHPDIDPASASQQLSAAAIELARKHNASSVHWLFTTESEKQLLAQQGLLSRRSYQFHWHNLNYQDFDDYLLHMTSGKRKKVRRERRYVSDAGIKMVRIAAADATDEHWQLFYQFYLRTIMLHGATPYLNETFFRTIGETMPDNVFLLFARLDNNIIAGALFLESEDTLYGRYWGSHDDYHSLHFETCYYAPIEYCINKGLQRFEAGAQGRHKLARGFLPMETHSAHWLSEPQFNNAIADYLKYEGQGVEDEISELKQRSPFKYCKQP